MFDTTVLVLGDLMLDVHVYGHVRRISPEAPVPVVGWARENQSPGGAGNVAATLASLGCSVAVAGLLGDDPQGRRLLETLRTHGVAEAITCAEPGLATITKTRILSDAHHQLLRLDHDGDRAAFAHAAGKLLEAVLPRLGEFQAVVLADYEKGVITPATSQPIIARCRELNIPCVVDPKKTDFNSYARATLLTPNLLEAERAMGHPLVGDAAVAEAAEHMRAAFDLDAMLITRSGEGMTLASPNGVTHIPAQTRAVADVTGAGDTVVATLAAALASGWNLAEACRLASTAAGIAVSHPGTYVVRAEELETAWHGHSPKILTWEAARQRVATAQARGLSVVFTNGCFDILHAGHLASLEGAKRLGDVLVVGVNSDASVRGLKGETRPVISQENRASLLAGLACVDIVVVFDEPTPENLIRCIEPDVLTKGGDYTLDQIAGADFVLARGGRVITVPLVPGLSTTFILNRNRSGS